MEDPRLNTIPGLIVGARQWIFPSMVFTCNGSITKWVFRATPSIGSQLPQFQVWKRANNDVLTDFILVATSGSSLELEDRGEVYEYQLHSPIPILENYTFGILLPFGSQSELYSLVVELWGILGAPTSYYRSSIGTTFSTTITGVPIQDYIPLVTAEISKYTAKNCIMVSMILNTTAEKVTFMEYGSTPYGGMARGKNGCRMCPVYKIIRSELGSRCSHRPL